jgi:hypothetical protein
MLEYPLEPGEGEIVIDAKGRAWQRENIGVGSDRMGGWAGAYQGSTWKSWIQLNEQNGPLYTIKAGDALLPAGGRVWPGNPSSHWKRCPECGAMSEYCQVCRDPDAKIAMVFQPGYGSLSVKDPLRTCERCGGRMMHAMFTAAGRAEISPYDATGVRRP